MKKFKEMSYEERKAHVKEVSDWIRNEIKKDKIEKKELCELLRPMTQKEISQVWNNAGCVCANKQYNPNEESAYGITRGILGNVF